MSETQIPAVVGVKPIGSQILIELLNAQELSGSTKLIIGSENAAKEWAPQAYVVALGPSVTKEWGVAVGDRVAVVGNFNPMPISSPNGRKLVIIEPHVIKAVLVEAK